MLTPRPAEEELLSSMILSILMVGLPAGSCCSMLRPKSSSVETIERAPFKNYCLRIHMEPAKEFKMTGARFL